MNAELILSDVSNAACQHDDVGHKPALPALPPCPLQSAPDTGDSFQKRLVNVLCTGSAPKYEDDGCGRKAYSNGARGESAAWTRDTGSRQHTLAGLRIMEVFVRRVRWLGCFSVWRRERAYALIFEVFFIGCCLSYRNGGIQNRHNGNLPRDDAEIRDGKTPRGFFFFPLSVACRLYLFCAALKFWKFIFFFLVHGAWAFLCFVLGPIGKGFLFYYYYFIYFYYLNIL